MLVLFNGFICKSVKSNLWRLIKINKAKLLQRQQKSISRENKTKGNNNNNNNNNADNPHINEKRQMPWNKDGNNNLWLYKKP